MDLYLALQPQYIWFALNDDIGDVLTDTDVTTICKNGICDVMPTVYIPFMAPFRLKLLIACGSQISCPIWAGCVLLAQHSAHRDMLYCIHVQCAIYVVIVSIVLLS